MFTKFVATKAASPHITVSKGKRIHVSKSLLAQMGNPDHIFLYFDSDTMSIGISAAKKGEAGAYAVQGRSEKNKSSMLSVYAKLFLDHIGFGPEQKKFPNPRIMDGMLTFGPIK